MHVDPRCEHPSRQPLPPRPPIRIYLLDDQEVDRLGIRRLASRHRGITVVGDSAFGASAWHHIIRLRPSVLVLETRVADTWGPAFCRQIKVRCPGLQVIFLTSFANSDDMVEAMMSGASGYLSKSVSAPELFEAIRRAHEGIWLFSSNDRRELLAHLSRNIPPGRDILHRLTGRERRILEYLGDGLNNEQISRQMQVGDKTIKNNLTRLYSKLGIHHRTGAAILVVQHRPAAYGQRRGYLEEVQPVDRPPVRRLRAGRT